MFEPKTFDSQNKLPTIKSELIKKRSHFFFAELLRTNMHQGIAHVYHGEVV